MRLQVNSRDIREFCEAFRKVPWVFQRGFKAFRRFLVDFRWFKVVSKGRLAVVSGGLNVVSRRFQKGFKHLREFIRVFDDFMWLLRERDCR